MVGPLPVKAGAFFLVQSRESPPKMLIPPKKITFKSMEHRGCFEMKHCFLDYLQRFSHRVRFLTYLSNLSMIARLVTCNQSDSPKVNYGFRIDQRQRAPLFDFAILVSNIFSRIRILRRHMSRQHPPKRSEKRRREGCISQVHLGERRNTAVWAT
jgi:hypothetical protein